MQIKRVIFGLALSLAVALSVFLGINSSLRAQEKSSSDANSAKIDEILQTQKNILEQITSIKEQLTTIQSQTNKL